ncbi:hypothetical protein [Streptomyces sp. NBC_01174]|nr:hypothetical protein OG414_40680 [Streptomyces sp. NBC_01174]
MPVTIRATPPMERAERRSLLCEALVQAPHEYGYGDAEVDLL